MTANEVILRIGRQRVIAALGVSTAQVSNCLKAGKFPAHWFDAMDQMAVGDGWVLPRDLFAWRKREDVA